MRDDDCDCDDEPEKIPVDEAVTKDGATVRVGDLVYTIDYGRWPKRIEIAEIYTFEDRQRMKWPPVISDGTSGGIASFYEHRPNAVFAAIEILEKRIADCESEVRLSRERVAKLKASLLYQLPEKDKSAIRNRLLKTDL